MDLSLWDVVRLRVSSLVKPKKPESTFISHKPKLTKVVAYNDVLDYNSQSSHIFNQIKTQ
jgi:hypothetical protein